MMSWPVLTVSIVVVVLSVILALMILLHKGRGGGLSDLFGGGMSTSLGGTSIAERNLDRITTIIGGALGPGHYRAAAAVSLLPPQRGLSTTQFQTVPADPGARVPRARSGPPFTLGEKWQVVAPSVARA